MKLFWDKVQVLGLDECWEWTGKTNHKGYGHFSSGRNHGLSQYASRTAYILTRGSITSTQQLVCHTCDNRKCCNPTHLFLGTNQDNMDDMKAKGRSPRMSGTNNPLSRLTDELVKFIYSSPIPGMQLAKELNINKGTISKIRRGRAWVHVTGGAQLPHQLQKISDDQVREIRDSPLPNRRLAEQYQVDVSCISLIRHGKTRKNVL